ncbi:MAG: dTDP-4-dehydrorhamnose 3,5-epimerase [Proteobacteria bacterium]|nr:MAG: dTDP-4-dehydrorhamnose 3,5-epimerase [Pseudomonadota bacterium]
MKKNALAIADVVEIVPDRHADERGYFAETFRDDWFQREVAPVAFVQENQSLSRGEGTIRGLHFQRNPMAQGKLVRCLTGAIWDIAVDIRPGSSSFGRWVGITLTPAQGNQLWIPPGFLHGFCTLMPETEVSYKVTQYYSPQHDAGVAWDDPEIGIDWPLFADPKSLSAKDTRQPSLRELRNRLGQQLENS